MAKAPKTAPKGTLEKLVDQGKEAVGAVAKRVEEAVKPEPASRKAPARRAARPEAVEEPKRSKEEMEAEELRVRTANRGF